MTGRYSANMRRAVLASLLLCITGCSWLGQLSWWRDRSMDYQQAQLSPPLVVPETLQTTTAIAASTQQTTLKIPSKSTVSAEHAFVPSADYPVPRTQVLIKSQFGNALQLHNQQGQLWIESQLNADDVWSMTQRFVGKQNYLRNVSSVSAASSTTSAQAKVLQSDWLRAKAIPIKLGFWAKSRRLFSWSSPWARYQWRLTPEANGYALRLFEQRTASKADTKTTREFVASQPDEAALKRLNFLSEQLFDFYSLSDTKTAAPVVASNQKPRVELIRDGNDYPVLVIEQAFVQAWETVGESLQHIKVRVEDLNRTTGVYYLRLKSNTIELPEAPLVLRVSRNQKGTQVTLEQDDETLPPKPAAEQLLQALYKDMQSNVEDK
jgi:outer membrane protein assembly factor BamC